MIEHIKRVSQIPHKNYKFSLLIPTWNNLSYLKLCISSIRKNSHYDLQIIVVVNEGTDGTTEWIEQQQNIDYVLSKENIGICYALNITRSMIKSDYVVYLNDDMYVLPGWDKELYREIKSAGTKSFMLSSTMIEPVETGNPCVVVKNYGTSTEDFQEEKLLEAYRKLVRNDWRGSTWPPNVIHIDLWDLIGGYSIEFSPGMYSDPDLSRKLYEVGVHHFKGVGKSLVYHFGTKSTGRVKQNKGRITFIRKWGISAKQFTTKYLHICEPFTDKPPEKPSFSFFERMVNLIKILKSYF